MQVLSRCSRTAQPAGFDAEDAQHATRKTSACIATFSSHWKLIPSTDVMILTQGLSCGAFGRRILSFGRGGRRGGVSLVLAAFEGIFSIHTARRLCSIVIGCAFLILSCLSRLISNEVVSHSRSGSNEIPLRLAPDIPNLNSFVYIYSLVAVAISLAPLELDQCIFLVLLIIHTTL